MIILAIPIYYQVSSYISYPHTPHYPTTTAEYIALPSSTDLYVSDRNRAIAKDAVAWGWQVYEVDETSPKTKTWWAQYEAAAKEQSWDDDIWRIWQREHGVRIAEEHMSDVDDRKERSSKMRVVIRCIKKLEHWANRSREAAESELRQYEERRKRLRVERKMMRQEERRMKLRQDARKKGKTADEVKNDDASEISLPESFIERLEAWKGSAVKGEKRDRLKLTQHPWLSQR